jgi:hypothetical protein
MSKSFHSINHIQTKSLQIHQFLVVIFEKQSKELCFQKITTFVVQKMNDFEFQKSKEIEWKQINC